MRKVFATMALVILSLLSLPALAQGEDVVNSLQMMPRFHGGSPSLVRSAPFPPCETLCLPLFGGAELGRLPSL